MRKRPERGPVLRGVVVGLFALTSLAGCNDKVPQYREGAVAGESASAPPAGSALPPSPGGDRRNQRKRSDTPVFVDGDLRAVLAYGELPVGFEPTVVDRRGDYRICNVARYLEALGVDLARVKALHLQGSNRTAVIEGDEVRRMKDKLHFAFSKLRGTFGKPIVDWPSEKVISTTRIDKISGVQVFVDKPAPTWDPKKKAFFWDDGSAVEGMPHVGDFEPIKSARVYLDGKLLGFVKEEDVPKDIIKTGDGRGSGKKTDVVTDEGHQGENRGGGRKGGGTGGGKRIVLAQYLAHLGVDTDRVTALEVIGEDRVLARFDKDTWAANLETLTFGIPKRSSKRLRIELPEAATPYPGPVSAQAIVVYTKLKPTDREIAQPKRRPRNN